MRKRLFFCLALCALILCGAARAEGALTVFGVQLNYSRYTENPMFVPVGLPSDEKAFCVAFDQVFPEDYLDAEDETWRQAFDGARIITPDGAAAYPHYALIATEAGLSSLAFGNAVPLGATPPGDSRFQLCFSVPSDMEIGDCMLLLGDWACPLSEDCAAYRTYQEGALKAPAPTPVPTPSPTPEPTPEPARELEPYELAIERGKSLLAAAAEPLEDPWQKYILAQDWLNAEALESEGGWDLRFSLCAMDPGVAALPETYDGKYAETLAAVSENLAGNSIEASLRLTEAGLEEKGLAKLLSRAKSAGKAALNGFNDQRIRLMLSDLLLPQPFATSAKPRANLSGDDTGEAFQNVAALYGGVITEKRLRVLLCATKPEKLYVRGGPDKMVLSFKAPDPQKLVSAAYESALSQLRGLTLANELTDGQIGTVLLNHWGVKAIEFQSGSDAGIAREIEFSYAQAVAMEEPLDAFSAYCKEFVEPYKAAMRALIAEVRTLPSFPEQETPQSGATKTRDAGTTVVLYAPGDGLNRYVRLIDRESGEEAAAGFIRPGSVLTLTAPEGVYDLVDARGEKWYGVKRLFAEEGSYSLFREISVPGEDLLLAIRLGESAEGSERAEAATLEEALAAGGK